MEEKEFDQSYDENGRMRRTVSQKEQYRQSVLSGAILVYNVNVTKNLIEDEIYETVEGKQIPLISMAGFTLPCNFNAFSKTWAENYVDSDTRKIFYDHFNQEYLQQTYSQGINKVEFEYRSKLGLGIYKSLRNTVFLIEDEESGDLIARCNVKNISGEKAKEYKLHQYEQMFINVAADLYVDVLQVDMESWETIRIGTKDQKFTSEEAGNWEVFQEELLAFVHPSDKEEVRAAYSRRNLERMKVGEKFVWNYRSVRKTAEGTEKYFSANIIISETDGHKFATVFTIDNTSVVENERKQKELIEHALFQAEQANRAKSVFLSNMSHDIRTPMNAIIGFTALATTHIDNKERVKDYLAKIMSSSNHLLSLINDVLDMSRIENGRIQLEETACSLADIMHEIRNILQADIKKKQLDFFIDTVDVLDENVLCDRLRFNQILLNLLGNAIKFTKPGGSVGVRITEKPGAPEGSANYEIRVKDTGIGMSKEFMQHLFEPFEREKNTTVSGIQGTGLGMSITKNIVELMGGTIGVSSEKGKGTEFTVNLTLKLAERLREEIRLEELEGCRALVADDDFNTCDSVTQMLIQIGMRAEWTLSGKEAVLRTTQAINRNDAYKVYIIDWLMPDMNGVEVVRRIRQVAGDKAPIIILTAYDWSDIEEEAKETGVSAFCSKPLFLSDLHKCLLQAVHPETKKEKTEQNREWFKGKRLLLVEDNELNREIASAILEEAGFLVEEAENGAVSVEMLKKAGADYYDLVLMDVQMPVMDGYQATEAIRALEDKKLSKILIIAMTANAFEEDKKRAMECGMDAHIAKPINVETLLNTLEELL